MRQVLTWAMDHDKALALRLAVALAPWWLLRGAAVNYPLLHQAAWHAAAGGDRWCAAHFWLGQAALYAADPKRALGHFTAVRDAIGDRGPSRALADCLAGRSKALSNLGRMAEAAKDGRRSLAMARKLGYPAAEALALMDLSEAALKGGDPGAALQLARQAAQIPADTPGWIARQRSFTLSDALIEAGDLAAAERCCAAGLDRSRDAGDLRIKTKLLMQMAYLDLQAGRAGDAAVRLRESVDTAARTGGWGDVLNCLDVCGYLCAATGRSADAVTVWAAHGTLLRREGGADWPVDARRRQDALRTARQMLGPVRARAAGERGAAMSLATAAEYALLLTAPGRAQSQAPPGPGMLSAREWELITLVAQGRTNAQIADQLYISARTVSSHLDRIRDKTGCRRRADLTRLALTRGLV